MRHKVVRFTLLVSCVVFVFTLGVAVVSAEEPTPTPATPVITVSDPNPGDTAKIDVTGIVTDTVSPDEKAEEEASFKVKVMKAVLKLIGAPDIVTEFNTEGLLKAAFGKITTWVEGSLFPDFESEDKIWNVWRNAIHKVLLNPVVVILAACLYFVRLGVYLHYEKWKPMNPFLFFGILLLFVIFLGAGGTFWGLLTTIAEAAFRFIAETAGSTTTPASAFDIIRVAIGASSNTITAPIIGLLVWGAWTILFLFLMKNFIVLIVQPMITPFVVAGSLVAEEKPYGAARAGLWIYETFLWLILLGGLGTVVLYLAVSKEFVDHIAAVAILGPILVVLISWKAKSFLSFNLDKKLARMQAATEAPKEEAESDFGSIDDKLDHDLL